MRDFTFQVPTEIVFGVDTVAQVGRLCKKYGGSRVLVVYGGGSAQRSGLLDRVLEHLKEAGLMAVSFGGVRPNPQVQHAQKGLELALAEQVDLVLAVGGGSVIDTCKAIAIGAKQPENPLWEIWSKGLPVHERLPLGVILTIPAAGSETSASAIISNDETHEKLSVRSTLNASDFTIMDPALPATLPRYQLGCGVVDIMMHTLDRYFNGVFDNEMTDEIAEGLLRTVIRNGRKIVEDPTDVHAMSEIMWCGSLSHNSITGLGGTRDCVVHRLGNEFSAYYDITHGASLSAVWTAWARYVWQEHPDRFARYGRNVWGLTGECDAQIARQSIEATHDYFCSLDMPVTLPQLGLTLSDEDLDMLALACSRNKTRRIGSFREIGYEDMLQIYLDARDGQ